MSEKQWMIVSLRYRDEAGRPMAWSTNVSDWVEQEHADRYGLNVLPVIRMPADSAWRPIDWRPRPSYVAFMMHVPVWTIVNIDTRKIERVVVEDDCPVGGWPPNGNGVKSWTYASTADGDFDPKFEIDTVDQQAALDVVRDSDDWPAWGFGW